MVSTVIKEEVGSWRKCHDFQSEGRGWTDLKKLWSRNVEGNFRTLVLDGRNQVLASGEAMLFPGLGVGAFYPDSPEVMDLVSREARVLLKPNCVWEAIRNLRPRQDIASLPRIYFDWGWDEKEKK